jgi:hypothetical protein
MNCCLTILMLACAGLRADACEMTVRVYCSTLRVDSVPGPLLLTAHREASRLLEAAGIRLEWHDGAPAKDEDGRGVVAISFLPGPPPAFLTAENAHALAAARPYATSSAILVFADRVANYLFPYTTMVAGKVLGHVLAHEIGHVLEGLARHSESGLMKATWTPDDLRDMMRSRFAFADDDVQLLQLRFRGAACVESASR